MGNPFSPGTHKFEAPGVTLMYTVKGNGPNLFVQAAGWGISSRYLQIGLTRLEDAFTLIYPEPRGSGSSSMPGNPADMSSSDMANDLEHLRQHLGLDEIDLFGHSNGGSIALEYAERYPGAVRKLVLVTHWLSGYNDAKAQALFLNKRRDEPQYAKAFRAFKVGPNTPGLTDEDWVENLRDKQAFYFANVERDLETYLGHMGRPSRQVSNAQSAADKAKPVDLYAELGAVTARTLVVGCAEDPVCTANVSRVTAEGIEGAELRIMENCGHYPWIEKPDEFFSIVLSFLTPG